MYESEVDIVVGEDVDFVKEEAQKALPPAAPMH
jgi:hypothetical protein